MSNEQVGRTPFPHSTIDNRQSTIVLVSSNPHKQKDAVSVRGVVLTISDTRTPETDSSGALIRERLGSAGHSVVGYEILPDEPKRIAERVMHWCESGDCDAIILTGGTGLAPRDTTHEAVSGLLEKTLDGFGELFRMLSYQEIGAAAMLSRAVGGVRGATVVFSLPGSTAAVRLAMERLIVPQLSHIVGLLGAHRP